MSAMGSMADELSRTVTKVREAVVLARDRLKNAAILYAWKSNEGDFSPDQCEMLHDKWAQIQLPFSWVTSDNARTFYHKLDIPSNLAGISTIGSKAELEVRLVIGTEIYVNGNMAYRADYWADTKLVPIPLTPAIAGPESFDIVGKCKQGDGFGFFANAEVRISAVDEWIFQLDTFAEEIGFAHYLIENGDIGSTEVIRSLGNSLTQFDIMALEINDWSRVEKMIGLVRQTFDECREAAKQYKVYLIGHAHIDMNWLWPWEETVDLIRRDFQSIDRIMEEFPQVCFSHSQAATYKVVKERFPELWDRVKRRIKEGRWEVTAATWVEGDLNMAGYETLVRQFLLGKTFTRNELDAESCICWEPDTFGHPATMPHILGRSGIKYYYHTRAGKGNAVYWWEGLEGTRILAFNDPRGYNGKIFASSIVAGNIEMAKTYGLKCNMYVYGVGDHGGGVTRQDVVRAIRLNASPVLPVFEFAKTADFFKDIENSGMKFPIVRGELNSVFEGCYTSHGDIKAANRQTEHALVRAETAAAIAYFSNRIFDATGVERLKDAWEVQCFNQFHDIVCGCSIHSTYESALSAADRAKKQADLLFNGMKQSLVRDTADSIQITVLNTLSWERTDIVMLQVSDHPYIKQWETGDRLEDAAGNAEVVQCCEQYAVFVARNVPALGFKTYTLKRGVQRDEGQYDISYSKMKNPIVTNGKYQIEIDHESGTIVSLLDTATNRELSHTPQDPRIEFNQTKGILNLLEVQYEAPHAMSAWKIGTITQTKRLVRGAEVVVGREGPVMQSVHVVHRVERSVIRQEIRVYRGLERIDFVTDVEWGELGTGKTDAAMLRVYFTPQIAASHHSFDIPFGFVERSPNGREMPAIHWIDISEKDAYRCYGMSLLNNGKYGHAIQGCTLSMTLLRSSYEPDRRSDVGNHQFTYAVYPHESGWREAQTNRKALELHQPLSAVFGSSDGDTGILRIEEHTASGWKPAANTVVTALKPAENIKGGWIVRIAEMHARPANLRITFGFPVESVTEVNVLEDVVRSMFLSDRRTILVNELQPYQILTLCFTTPDSWDGR